MNDSLHHFRIVFKSKESLRIFVEVEFEHHICSIKRILLCRIITIERIRQLELFHAHCHVDIVLERLVTKIFRVIHCEIVIVIEIWFFVDYSKKNVSFKRVSALTIWKTCVSYASTFFDFREVKKSFYMKRFFSMLLNS